MVWPFVCLLFLCCVHVCKLSITFPVSAESETDVSDVSVHSNNLGLATVKFLNKPFNNIVLSPWNIYTCLGILQLGAGGRTKDELSNILGTNISPENISASMLQSESVSQASAVFVDRTVQLNSDFGYAAFTYYQAPVYNVSFTETQETQDAINRWVAYQTNGSIPELLKEHLDSSTLSVVVSAVYFSAQWLNPFPPDLTTRLNFTVANDVLEIDFMRTAAVFPVYTDDHITSISLPYESPDLTMHLVLPRGHSSGALHLALSRLTPANIDRLVQLSEPRQAWVHLPKVKVSTWYSLKKVLVRQGLQSIFNPLTANMTGLAEDQKMYLTDVYHSVYLEMTETGTRAAAATGGGLVRTKGFVFQADRPFVFFIRHSSGLVLFMGIIARPV